MNNINTCNTDYPNVITVSDNNVKYYEKLAEDFANAAEVSANNCANYLAAAQVIINECENIKNSINTSFAAEINAHLEDISNPHSVTAAQVGAYTIEQVDNLFNSYVTYSQFLDDLANVLNQSVNDISLDNN